MSAPTPDPAGPWRVTHDEWACYYAVFNGEELIAELFYARGFPEDQERQRVKAHMIAAAPVLVEALEACLDRLTGMTGVPHPVAQARAALAAARGEGA